MSSNGLMRQMREIAGDLGSATPAEIREMYVTFAEYEDGEYEIWAARRGYDPKSTESIEIWERLHLLYIAVWNAVGHDEFQTQLNAARLRWITLRSRVRSN